MSPVSSAEQVSEIAFGFMASKALFSGLHLGLFDQIADGAKTVEAAAAGVGISPDSAATLMTALAGMGLLVKQGDGFVNSHGAQNFLVREAPHYFGDYLKYQIDQQMYGFMEHLYGALKGEHDKARFDTYEAWMSDPKEAALFSESQHSGSLGPGAVMAKRVDLSNARSLLDVGGGSGAFAIMMCKRYPDLMVTILDFPRVVEVAERYIADAGLSDRITVMPGNGITTDWPGGQDAVLMSYLFSGVPGDAIPRLIDKAWMALNPGGHLMLHDPMVEDDRTGPSMAALWALQHLTYTPGAVSLTPSWVMEQVTARGFTGVEVKDLIAGMTKSVVAAKPAA